MCPTLSRCPTEACKVLVNLELTRVSHPEQEAPRWEPYCVGDSVHWPGGLEPWVTARSVVACQSVALGSVGLVLDLVFGQPIGFDLALAGVTGFRNWIFRGARGSQEIGSVRRTILVWVMLM